MMGFGSFGANSSSSSSSPAFSNLSALAPPFSIDRSIPNKLNSNPIPHYSELTCGVMDRSNPNKLTSNPIQPQYSELTCGVEPFSQTWQYTQPSAPRSELIVDSVVNMPSIPPAQDVYQFSASASTSPSSGYWSKPFYSPYVPPMAGEEDPLHKDDGPRYDEVPHQVDYMQGLYGLEYEPRWTSTNLGSSYGKQQADGVGSMLSEKANLGVSHGYNNQLNQGHGTEYGSNYEEGTGVSCEPFSLVSDSNVRTTYTGMRHMEDKSFHEQNHSSFLPPDFSNKHMSAASSSLLASRPPGLSSETHNSFSDYHQNSCSKNTNSLWPAGSPFTPLVSTVRSSPAVVIRPPPIVSGVLGQNGVPRAIDCNDTAGYTVFREFDKDLVQQLNAEDKEDSYGTDLLSISNKFNDQNFFGSPSVRESSAPSYTKNTLDHDTEARFVSEPLKVNVLDGFSEVQVVAPADLSSDSVDRHSLGVDSPCWKGARVSQFSWLDVEDDPFNHSKRNEVYCFDLDKHENIFSAVDSSKTSGNALDGNKNQRTEVLHDGDLSSSNCVKPEVRVSAVTRSIGVQINKDIDIPRNDSGVPNNPKSGFDMKISKATNSKQFIGEIDTGSALNYVSDGDIAVHAAEKVLASPSSQDDTAEGTKLQPGPRMDVPAVIKAMHNFSELLLLQQSNDGFILEEKDSETLKLIINNLNSCMSKKIIQPIDGTNLDHAVGDRDTSKLGESACPNTESPHETSELKDSPVQRGYWSMYEEEYDNSGNKIEKSPVSSSLKDDLDLTKDDHVAKAIKKVLDENFNFNEEMHSQAHLFKSLWLEAEAKLCSVSYRARFDLMKLEMEKLKPKESIGDENVVERLSKLDNSRMIDTDAKVIRKEYDGLTVEREPLIVNTSLSSITVHADETEASVMARLSILKSREDKVKPINEEEEEEEEEKHPEVADCDSAGLVMDRFNILMARGENSKSFHPEEKHPEVADGDSGGSVMDRFNILMARGENSKSFHPEENTPEVSSARFADQNHLSTCIKDHYASPGKLNSSVANVPMIHSFYDSSRMMNHQYSLWQGSSSSSDWEHVMKDDLGWKNS